MADQVFKIVVSQTGVRATANALDKLAVNADKAALSIERLKKLAPSLDIGAGAKRGAAGLANLSGAAGRTGGAMNKLSRSARTARKDLFELDNVAHRLRQSLFAFGGLFIAREIIQMADAWTNLGNRLKLVTASNLEAAAAQRNILDIANNTRQPLEEVGQLFTRVSLATKSMGKSNRDVLAVTNTLSKAVVLSGASTQEASAGLRQFSQALASGKLQGDEFRSVMENIPFVADLIAEHLGVTRGELYALRTAGKLTSEVLFDSLFNAQDKISKLFEKTTPTIAQGFIVLQNAAQAFIGQFGAQTGAAEAFARGLILISQNMDTVARVLASGAIFAGLSKIISLFKGFLTFSPAGVFLTIVKAVGLAVAAMGAFSDKISVSKDGITKLSDVIGPLFEGITQAGKEIFTAFKELGTVFLELAGGPGYALQDLLIDTASMVKKIVGGIITSIFEVLILIERAKSLIPEIPNVDAFMSPEARARFRGNKPEDRTLKQVDQELLQQQALLTGFIVQRSKLKADLAAGNISDPLKIGEAQAQLETLDSSITKYGESIKKLKDELITLDPVKSLERARDRFLDSAKDFDGDRARAAARKNAVDRMAKEMARIPSEVAGELELSKNRPKTPQPPDAKAIEEWKKFQEQLRSLQDEFDPVGAARRKEAEEIDLLSKAFQRGLVDTGQYLTLLDQVNKKHRDAIDPIGAYRRAIEEESKQLRLSGEAKEFYNSLQERYNELAQTGAKLTLLQTLEVAKNQASLFVNNKEAEKRVAVMEEVRAAMEELKTPQERYEAELRRITELSKKYGLTETETTALVKKARKDLLQDDSFVGKLSKELITFNDLLSNQAISAINALGSEIAEFVTTGKANFKDFARSVVADLARILAQQILLNSVSLAFGGGAPLFGIAAPGFKTGGSFVVGGSGAPDSQLVAFRATPGEQVDIKTKQQQAASGEPMGGGGGPVTIKNINVSDPKTAMIEAMNSSEGEIVVMNILSKNGILGPR